MAGDGYLQLEQALANQGGVFVRAAVSLRLFAALPGMMESIFCSRYKFGFAPDQACLGYHDHGRASEADNVSTLEVKLLEV